MHSQLYTILRTWSVANELAGSSLAGWGRSQGGSQGGGGGSKRESKSRRRYGRVQMQKKKRGKQQDAGRRPNMPFAELPAKRAGVNRPVSEFVQVFENTAGRQHVKQ